VAARRELLPAARAVPLNGLDLPAKLLHVAEHEVHVRARRPGDLPGRPVGVGLPGPHDGEQHAGPLVGFLGDERGGHLFRRDAEEVGDLVEVGHPVLACEAQDDLAAAPAALTRRPGLPGVELATLTDRQPQVIEAGGLTLPLIQRVPSRRARMSRDDNIGKEILARDHA